LYKAIFDCNVPAVDEAEFAQGSTKCRETRCVRFRRQGAEKPYHRHCCLLRPRRERPRGGDAEQRDELAAVHSITSSARSSRPIGSSIPNARAALRLTMSENLVGCCTGKSPGLTPLRMRST